MADRNLSIEIRHPLLPKANLIATPRRRNLSAEKIRIREWSPRPPLARDF